MKVLGIYKELEEDERLVQESVDLCQIYSKGSVSFFSKLEKPDVSFAKAFLTSNRILLGD